MPTSRPRSPARRSSGPSSPAANRGHSKSAVPARHLSAVADVFKTRASIIIVTYRSASTITRCLRSIFAHLGEDDEVIIVDSASDDDTLGAIDAVLAAHPTVEERVRVIPFDDNMGPSIGRNRGAETASGEILAFVDPDIEVTTGWLENMLQHLEDPSVGAVGPLIDCGRGAQAASNHLPPELVMGSRAWEEGEDEPSGTNEVAKMSAEVFAGDYIRVGFLTGSCLITTLPVFEEIGGFDEDLVLGGEDYALAWQLILSDLELRVALDSFVSHAQHVSLDSIDPRLADYLIQTGANRLAEKVVAHSLAAGQAPPSPKELWGNEDLSPSQQGFEIIILDLAGDETAARAAARRLTAAAPVPIVPTIIRADDGLIDLPLLQEHVTGRRQGSEIITVVLGPDIVMAPGWMSRVAAASSAFGEYDIFVAGRPRHYGPAMGCQLPGVEPGSPLTQTAELTLEAGSHSFYAFPPGALTHLMTEPVAMVAGIDALTDANVTAAPALDPVH